MLTSWSVMLTEISEDDLDIGPRFDAPWMGPLNNMGGYILGTLIVASIIILAVGVVMFLVGRAASNSGMQGKGSSALIVGLIGVAILGSITGIVLFFANLNIF